MSGVTRPDSREVLARELLSGRAVTDALFSLIDPGALYDRPVAERHRLIFYLGHLEAFDWNLLSGDGPGAWGLNPGINEGVNKGFNQLFARGIDPPPGQAAADTPDDWPDRGEVEAYRRRTREEIDRHLSGLDPHLVEMAIEHRHMHAETLAYLLHALDYRKKLPQPQPAAALRASSSHPWIAVSSGSVQLGTLGDGFAWDNERTAHQIDVADFRIRRFKVSNGEYLEFVREGGEAPNFWVERSGSWFYQGMFEEMPLPLDWPVWTTWNQAAAYAAWLALKTPGLKLASEAQFHRASTVAAPSSPKRDNFDYQRWDPVAVDAGAEPDGDAPHQLIGNGWEWTRDVFAPYAGFEPHPSYAGYSADFFDGQHYVLKGASPRTAARLTRPGFRNWFRPDYPHMYAGFRLVQS